MYDTSFDQTMTRMNSTLELENDLSQWFKRQVTGLNFSARGGLLSKLDWCCNEIHEISYSLRVSFARRGVKFDRPLKISALWVR